MDILEFSEKDRWLSNFARCWVLLDGIKYPTTENAYQASKTIQKKSREQFETISPGKAKRMGQKLEIRDDWDDVKVSIMTDLNRQKYNQAPFRQHLLSTGDYQIVEGNTWGDVFWGVCNGVGENNLGKIIMKIREELRR